MLDPGTIKLILSVGMITGLVQALITRIYFKSIHLSLLIIAGSIIGSALVYFVVSIQNPKIFSYLFDVVWTVLGPPLGAGTPSGGNFGGMAMLILTMLLVQIVGSVLGGLLGLRIWMYFLRS